MHQNIRMKQKFNFVFEQNLDVRCWHQLLASFKTIFKSDLYQNSGHSQSQDDDHPNYHGNVILGKSYNQYTII